MPTTPIKLEEVRRKPDIIHLRDPLPSEDCLVFKSICRACGPVISITAFCEVLAAGWRPQPLLDAAVEDHHRRFHLETQLRRRVNA